MSKYKQCNYVNNGKRCKLHISRSDLFCKYHKAYYGYSGAAEDVWTKEKLKESLDRYLQENGKLPTASEVDECTYLPSARQIQRAFGGLKKLRLELGYEDTDFSSGKHRIEKVKEIAKAGREAELIIEEILVSHFGELFVHPEKHYSLNLRNRVDFMVYSMNENFGVEVFFTDDIKSFRKILNLKVQQYMQFPKNKKLYFVVANNGIDMNTINTISSSTAKLSNLPLVEVCNIREFQRIILNYSPLIPPPGFISATHV